MMSGISQRKSASEKRKWMEVGIVDLRLAVC